MPRPAEAVTAALSAATQVWKPRSELHSDSQLQPRRGRSAERQAEREHAGFQARPLYGTGFFPLFT